MENIASQLSNVSLYDVKKYVRKAQNAVLNFSEMEAKVREATNNEPWGTPTSTMQQIADATNNYQQFHEILPFIYRRFTEKSASEWRQIYKSLQLLDYLVRNGSERVVDYARSHVSVVEMLRHFSYIDSRGVDQGASIRKRAEELVGLLANTEKLRVERKKAKQLNAKTANSGYGSGGFGGSGRKYGGISSETFRQQVYGDGGGFDGSNNIMPPSSNAGFDDDEFEEYEVSTSTTARNHGRTVTSKTTMKKTNDEEDEEDEDDFADFQTAPTASTTAAPTTQSTSANILDLFDMPATTTAAPPAAPAASSSSTAQLFASTPASPSTDVQSTFQPSQPAPKPAASTDLFDSLWESSKTSSVAAKPASQPKMQPQQPTQAPQPTQKQDPKPSTSSEPVDLLSF